MAAVYGLTCFQWLTLAVLGVIWRYLGLLGHRMGTTFGHKNVIERNHAPVAQMDRVRASGARGRGFESRRARHYRTPTARPGFTSWLAAFPPPRRPSAPTQPQRLPALLLASG